MHLKFFTDLSLRILIYLAVHCDDRLVTLQELSEQLQASRNHVAKATRFMVQQGWIQTSRGRSGGLRLSRAPEEYRVGDLARVLEGPGPLLDCARPPCPLRSCCLLGSALATALGHFFEELNQATLATAVAPPRCEDPCPGSTASGRNTINLSALSAQEE